MIGHLIDRPSTEKCEQPYFKMATRSHLRSLMLSMVTQVCIWTPLAYSIQDIGFSATLQNQVKRILYIRKKNFTQNHLTFV